MFCCLLLVLFAAGAQGWEPTRYREIDINGGAVDRDNIIVLTGLSVYRDELVVLDTYGGVITVNVNMQTDNLTVNNSLFDPLVLSHVYTAVDAATGLVAVCTNRRGRCQYMNVSSINETIGFGEELILAGEQGEQVDIGILLLIANTQSSVPSLYTASGNAVTIGQLDRQRYPIRAAQLAAPLAVSAELLAESDTLDRKYIAMIRAEGFVYTVAEDGGQDMRVTRVCESDSTDLGRFHSLYQTILTPCVSVGALELLDARLIVLSNGMESNYLVVTFEEGSSVSVCAYSLSSINQAMNETYRSCVVDETGVIPNEGLFGSLDNLQCSLYSDPSVNTECNLWTIVGESATNRVFLEAGAVAGGIELFSGVTSSIGEDIVTTTKAQESGDTYYYLYFVQHVTVRKYLLDGLSVVQPPLETLTFPETITAVELDQSGANLFAVTNGFLYSIPLEDCGRHAYCLDCVSDRDPLCGWCSVQSVCSKRSDCQSNNLTNRWIDTDSSACLAVSAVSPDISNLNVVTNVTLTATNLPELSGERYECEFSAGGDTYRVSVTAVNGDTSSTRGPVNGTANLTCPVPTGLSSLTDSDTRVYSLSLSSTLSALIGDTVEYRIVDCGYNRNCSSCVGSNATCGWCLYDSTCVPYSNQCVMEEWVQPTASQTLCPIIVSEFNTSSLQVPALETTNITLLGGNLPPPTLVYYYTCVLSLQGAGGTTEVPGAWRNTSGANAEIDCQLTGSTIGMEGTGSVQLVWGPSRHSISQGTLEFDVFICGNQLDCASCLSNTACSWCTDTSNTTGLCNSVCGAGMNTFTPSSICPQPQISGFTPVSTAVGGTVEITVTGGNLAIDGRDTIVRIGDRECTVVTANTTQVTCQFQAAEQVLSHKLNVTVAGTSVESGGSFVTAQPVINSTFPAFTPQFGGSNVTLFGSNLSVGANRRVTAGPVECVIREIASNATDDWVVCTTGTSESTGSPLMSITIDSVVTTYTDGPLDVLTDPQVNNVFLEAPGGQQLRQTIVSGVLDYSLRGSNLGATVSQYLVFMAGDTEISRSECVAPADPEATRLECKQEAFSGVTPATEGTDVRFELIMDSVPNVTQLFFQVFSFKLYADPVFPNGERTNRQTIPEGETNIEINIPNIDILPSEAIKITQINNNNQTINEYICGNPQFTSNGIKCTLNQTTTTTPTTTTNTEIVIQIVVGLNKNAYSLRETVAVIPKDAATKFLEENMATLAAVGVLLLLLLLLMCVFLCVCCCCLVRSKRSTRIKREEAEHLLAEMEDIENDLADRCRKGFTALNTQIGLDDGDLVVGAIPIHSFKIFALRILFPGLQDHPVLHPVEKPRTMDDAVFEAGLQKFDRLVNNKEFLIAMIHSMEENRNFSVRDRCNVASLLTAALFNSMPYLTEVLFELLEELINRNITRNTSKLLLRRTESVAEKLLADWLAFNLYEHLQGPPSVAMYRMFLGIKGHLESGPVDVLNGSAGHSLSEEKLMRQEVEHMKIEVETEATDGTRYPCKLLDCDTITQTKIKVMDVLYKGMGFSQRPKLEDVELELRSQGGGRLQLRDNDMTNEGDEEWRRINTLSHYHIHGGMVLSIVQRKQKPNPGQVWDYPGTSIYDFGHTQSLSRLLSMDEESSKVYHLQKSEEVEDYQEQTRTLRRRQYGSEIFLPKLVATKRILQTYIDQLIDEIFPEAREVPRAIKVLYDFLDTQGALYGIEDPEVLHTWKNNSVPLRFWVNLLKNPEFLLDVAKSASLDSALSVISQAFIDGCSIGQTYITRDSPTNKLLYHKEVQTYKQKVKKYYEMIRNAPAVNKNSLTFNSADFLGEGERQVFYVESAVYGLFNYAQSYQEGIKTRLGNENLDALQESFEEVCLDIAENLYMA